MLTDSGPSQGSEDGNDRARATQQRTRLPLQLSIRVHPLFLCESPDRENETKSKIWTFSHRDRLRAILLRGMNNLI